MRSIPFILAIALCFAGPHSSAADREMAPIQQRKPGQPLLAARQGWLTISNRDWVDYYLTLDVDNAQILLDQRKNGGTRIGSGRYLVVPLERAMWEIVGDSGADRVEVRIRPGQESGLALVPTGSTGRPGLIGVVMADGRRTTGTLYGVPAMSAAEPEQPGIPDARRTGFPGATGPFSLPAFGLNEYADPRGGANAGVFPQTAANANMENFHNDLYRANRGGASGLPDVMGDVLNELDDDAVGGITGNR